MSPLGKYLNTIGFFNSYTPIPADFIASDIYFHILTIAPKITTKILQFISNYATEPIYES